MAMNEEVILTFGHCGFLDMTGSGRKRVNINQDIVDWLREFNPRVPDKDTVEWLFGAESSSWAVRFTLQDAPTAVLFKLTFGGA